MLWVIPIIIMVTFRNLLMLDFIQSNFKNWASLSELLSRLSFSFSHAENGAWDTFSAWEQRKNSPFVKAPPLEVFSVLALEFWYMSFYINMGNKSPHYSSCSTSILNIFTVIILDICFYNLSSFSNLKHNFALSLLRHMSHWYSRLCSSLTWPTLIW